MLTCTNRLVLVLLILSCRIAARSPRRRGEPAARPDLSARSSGSSPRGRFLRLWWYEPGLEHGNPVTNRRFRVNAGRW